MQNLIRPYLWCDYRARKSEDLAKTVPRSSSLDLDDEFSLGDQANYNLERQNRVMDEFVSAAENS